MTPQVGVAIAVHSGRESLRECLDALQKTEGLQLTIVVVDDGSTDGTTEMLCQDFADTVEVLHGDGSLWWTGGTNWAVETCLRAGCDYILLLNPDVILEPSTIAQLLALASHNQDPIVAPVVVRHDIPEIVWWAGSKWQPLFPAFPFTWVSRYLFKAGTPTDDLPEEPFFTSEAHGRGVLVPTNVFDDIGLFDNEHFPHYGADTDFSFRARRAGYNILIAPQIRVRLHVQNTGLKAPATVRDSWRGYWGYLTQRKNGEALRVWWNLCLRHVPWYGVLPTYIFIQFLNAYRYWAAVVRIRKLSS